MNWVIDRLKESSTWRGLIWLLTVCGIVIRPEQAAAITTLGMAIAGALGVFLKDRLEKSNDSNYSGLQKALPPIDFLGRPERYAPPAAAPLDSQYEKAPFVPGADPARDRRVTDTWVQDTVPSESNFKTSSKPNYGSVGWNEDN